MDTLANGSISVPVPRVVAEPVNLCCIGVDLNGQMSEILLLKEVPSKEVYDIIIDQTLPPPGRGGQKSLADSVAYDFVYAAFFLTCKHLPSQRNFPSTLTGTDFFERTPLPGHVSAADAADISTNTDSASSSSSSGSG